MPSNLPLNPQLVILIAATAVVWLLHVVLRMSMRPKPPVGSGRTAAPPAAQSHARR